MSIQAVPTPELHPFMCLACHAHRCVGGFVSLDVDLLDGHAYLCNDCAQAVTHVSGGLTADQHSLMQSLVFAKNAYIEAKAEELAQAKLDQLQVVSLKDAKTLLGAAKRKPIAKAS